ncbi:tail fiber protein [Bacillus phage W.Ph.]|uniref:Gp2 n=1 Tax=Bacillus phage W.Ph. TaxID=764595 RepID=G9B1A3_9CAUD|nr:tail fiber protein [Bacillus phage W.Ph.]ADH03148.1 gp2 [Bacillus phage W.Ph.]
MDSRLRNDIYKNIYTIDNDVLNDISKGNGGEAGDLYSNEAIDRMMSDKASKKDLAASLLDKVDKDTVTKLLKDKANVTDLTKKADKSDIPDISGKADKTYVDEELDKKMDKGDLPEIPDLSGKADKSYVDEELSKKADTTYVAEIYATKEELFTWTSNSKPPNDGSASDFVNPLDAYKTVGRYIVKNMINGDVLTDGNYAYLLVTKNEEYGEIRQEFSFLEESYTEEYSAERRCVRVWRPHYEWSNWSITRDDYHKVGGLESYTKSESDERYAFKSDIGEGGISSDRLQPKDIRKSGVPEEDLSKGIRHTVTQLLQREIEGIFYLNVDDETTGHPQIQYIYESYINKEDKKTIM